MIVEAIMDVIGTSHARLEPASVPQQLSSLHETTPLLPQSPRTLTIMNKKPAWTEIICSTIATTFRNEMRIYSTPPGYGSLK